MEHDNKITPQGLLFGIEQLNRLFPNYVLIDTNLTISSYGDALKKTHPDFTGKQFTNCFLIKNPDTNIDGFSSLKKACHQTAIELETIGKNNTALKGRFEYLNSNDQILFAGAQSTHYEETNNESHFTYSIQANGTDITSSVSKEELLRLSLVASANESGVFFTYANGNIFWANDGFCKLTGYDLKEIIGKTPVELCKGPLTDRVTLRNMINSVNNGQSFNVELIHYRKNGECFWGRAKGQSYKTNGEKEFQYFAIIEDISAEKERDEQHKILSKIVEDNIDAVIITDKYEQITWVNTSFTQISGYTLDEVKGKKPGKLLQGANTSAQAVAYLREQINAAQDFSTEILNYSKTGKPYWLRIKGQPIYNSNKELTGFFALEEDITKEKESEDKLRTNEEKYRNIIANMNLGLLEVDNNDIITFANNSFCNMCAYTFQELIGKKAGSLFMEGDSSRLLTEKNKLRKEGVADAYEIAVKDKNGNLRWWLISGAPRYNDNGNLVGSIGIHLDISEQKKLQGELIEARIQAEQLGKTKENFLANMSHEIRTPMNAIMGMSNQLSKTDLNSQQKFYLDIIHSASDNLLVIINDILDLSKIEAGKLSIESIGFDLKEVASRAVQVVVHKAEEKGIKINDFYFDEKISPVLIGDPYRLNQVFLNLINNAIKFTEKGSVSLSFDLLNNTKDTQIIGVEIKDTGIGMDQAFVEHLFDKFSQEYESISRIYGGTGLGMSICKQLIELMGGTIAASSKKDEGTTVSFMVELKKGTVMDLPKKENLKLSKNFLQGKKILVVDDNEMNRLVALISLQNHGAKIIEAANGQQAIDAIKSQKIDTVLMDIQMPGLNGFETTKFIRNTGNTVPIIGLTANAIKGENEKCITAGMNDYVAKPFKEIELLKTIAKWLNAEVPTLENIEPEPVSSDPLYDLSGLKSISRGNEAFIHKMVNIFCDQTPELINEMIRTYDSGDFESMGAIAHKIKPSFDNLSIKSLTEMIRDIEKAGKEKIHNREIPVWLTQINDTVLQVISLMKKEYPSK